MKSVDVKDNTYIDFGKESNDKHDKFQVDAHIRILKYKNIFAKGYTVFVIKKVKSTVPWTLVILIVKKLLGFFTKKNCKKQIKKILGKKT